jgi:hypothetical protein
LGVKSYYIINLNVCVTLMDLSDFVPVLMMQNTQNYNNLAETLQIKKMYNLKKQKNPTN